MSKHNTTDLRSALGQLPSHQLDKMLQEELQKTHVDENAVRMLLQVLKEKDSGSPVDLSPEIIRAWDSYQQDITREAKTADKLRGAKCWTLRVAAVAAALCLVVAVVPQGAGAESFIERFVRWTGSVIEFFGPDDNDGRLAEYEFKTENPGLQQVYDAVVELGITDPVVPMWLPDGYKLQEFKTMDSPRKSGITAKFSDGTTDAIFIITVQSADASHQYYKDDTLVETYEKNGFVYRIVRNNERWVAIWTKDNLECSIFIDCQEDTLHRILASINKAEGTS